MSRKLLTLAYIYEMTGRYNEALACYEQVLEKDAKKLNTEIIKEARIGQKANIMALKYKENGDSIKRNLNMPLLEEKIKLFKQNPKNLTGWFSQWN